MNARVEFDRPERRVTSESVPCPLCGEATSPHWRDCRGLDLEYWIEREAEFHRCDACGLVSMVPLPTRDELPALYPASYHNYGPPSNRLDAFLLDRFHERHCSVTRRFLPPGGRLLEIGSARGDLLRKLQSEGYVVKGVEVSRDGWEASQQQGLDVFHGTLEEFETPERFDVVFMSHVIEHVIDPVATVKRLADLLVDGGVLYLETPNGRALDAKLWGRHWGLVHYPRHLYLFDRSTLRRLLEGGGFAVERTGWEINSCGWALSLQGWLRRCGIDRSRSPRSWYYPLLLMGCLPLNLVDLAFGGPAFMSAIARKRSAVGAC